MGPIEQAEDSCNCSFLESGLFPESSLDFRQRRQWPAGGAKLQLGQFEVVQPKSGVGWLAHCTIFPWCWNGLLAYFIKV